MPDFEIISVKMDKGVSVLKLVKKAVTDFKETDGSLNVCCVYICIHIICAWILDFEGSTVCMSMSVLLITEFIALIHNWKGGV